MDSIFNLDPLSVSLRYLDENRNKQALREAEEREWPSEVVEDILDAEEVAEPTRFRPNPIVFGGLF